MELIERLKSGWTMLKVIRVGLGGLILYTSITSGHTGGMIAGSVLLLFSLLTDGVCCMTGSCGTETKKTNDSTPENVNYEELDRK